MGELIDYLVENEEGFRKSRLPALYSDFRALRTINPDGYQANVSAWRRALARLARAGLAPNPASTPNILVLSADESLLRALESKQYGRPLALGAVVREAAAEKDLLPLQDFLRARESIYYKSWASLPWNVVSWGLRQLGITGVLGGGGGGDRMPGGQFVVLANVEEAARAFAEQTAGKHSRFERTYSKAHFQKTFASSIIQGKTLSETDMEVLLKFMSRDKGIVVYDGKTIRIKAPHSTDDTAAITTEDETIASLKELIEYLTHQTGLLNTKIDELGAAAKDAVARKNRVAALAALKSKRLAESSLEKRLATLGQLEEVAAKIEQASDSVQLVRVMGASADVLAGLNARVGGAERVDEVVDRLREQMGQADEVGSILAEAGAPSAVDEGEIDGELEEMEREERRKEEEAERTRRDAERAREEARTRREAEETARRLAELEPVKPIVGEKAAAEAGSAAAAVAEDTEETEELAEKAADTLSLSQLSLEEKPQAELAS
ncbi:Snf7 family protein [Pleurostoma richardsiae]|uniref:Snf7 family protein n=1 Tax=Pleurostoma richardsiae TaxID=41990 RepID=A0AA38RRB8_9PEZI|nr:Snf7 family protein [Pleurostoma richardsiae]